MVQLSHINKAYAHPSGPVSVLQDLSLQIEKGQSLAILGPSGSGKSTLLSILSGLERPDSGDVVMADQPLSSMSEKAITAFRSTTLGIIFQQFHLIPHLSALENVILSLDIAGQSNQQERAIQALKQVELSHRSSHFPSELSGGECQRVAMARAMATQPPILLADEPSGNLDQTTGEQVMETLFKSIQDSNTTMILVTHNQELALRCDRCCNMVSGQLVEANS